MYKAKFSIDSNIFIYHAPFTKNNKREIINDFNARISSDLNIKIFCDPNKKNTNDISIQ